MMRRPRNRKQGSEHEMADCGKWETSATCGATLLGVRLVHRKATLSRFQKTQTT